MNLKTFAAAASATLLVGAGQAAAATITIDTFNTPQAVAAEPIVTPSQPQGSEVSADEAIGGWRDLYVETDDTGNTAATTLEAGGGVLSFTNETFSTGSGSVTYDGNDGDPFGVDTDGLGGIDLFTGPLGTPGFFFEVITLDLPFEVTITAWDMSGATTGFGGTVSETGTPFAPFAAFSNSDFNWNSVGALLFAADSNGTQKVDAAIGSITADMGEIPLPASALLLLGGFGGLSVFGLRRKRS